MIAFASDYNPRAASNSTQSFYNAIQPNTQLKVGFSHPESFGERLLASSPRDIAALVRKALYEFDDQGIESVLSQFRTLCKLETEASQSFALRCFEAAAYILEAHSDPLITPLVPEIAFVCEWLSIVQNSVITCKESTRPIDGINQASEALFNLAIKLGESIPHHTFKPIYVSVLSRLRQNLFLSDGIASYSEETHRRLSQYVIDNIYVPRSLKKGPLERMAIFLDIASELKDPILTPFVAETTSKILKLFNWSSQNRNAAPLSLLKLHQQSDEFHEALAVTLETSLEVLSNLQEPESERFLKIWEQGLSELELGTAKWNTCLHALIDCSVEKSHLWLNDIIGLIIEVPDQQNLQLLLDIATSEKATGIIGELVIQKPISERSIFRQRVQELREMVEALKGSSDSCHRELMTQITRSLAALSEAIS